MNLTFSSERLLAVVAHPDDAELLCAGTLARAKSEGAAIGMCVLCAGDKGQATKPVKGLSIVRKREMQASSKLLGATLFMRELPDGTLVDSYTERLKLIEVFRRFKPTLVLAHAPEDYHPDHRAASALAEAASWFCASFGHKTRSAPLQLAPALWWMDTVTMAGFEPGFFIDVSEHLALKTQMLACHHSQLNRGKDPGFSPLGQIMRNQCSARGMQAGVEAAEGFRAHIAFKRARAW
jgi:LmbE family N-acetylglucosaminyl deacetylase